MSTLWSGTRLAFLLAVIASGLPAADPAHAPIPFKDPLQDKNFFLLSAIERTPAVRTLVQSDPALAQLATAKRQALSNAVNTCAADVACYANALRWTDGEITQARTALSALATKPAVSRFTGDVLRRSGMFVRYNAQPDAEFLDHAWTDVAHKMNRAIDIFLLGQNPRPTGAPPAGAPRPPAPPNGAAPQPPRIPGFELTAYDVKTPAFSRMVQIMAAIVGSEPKALELFFQPSLRFSIEALRLHNRDEAARHEPLEAGENRAAVARIPAIRWNQYPYTVIVVLGSGPDREGVALSPIGRLRLQLAVRDFREKKAPFLLVTGGYVHPALTPFSEAMEMKKALIRDFGIPEDAILVDPQARRTTTNLRNAARLLYRDGIPFDHKGLILTDQLHSATIEAPAFAQRCIRDFGYEPVRLGARISPFDLEFIPRIDSLQADANDLLDP